VSPVQPRRRRGPTGLAAIDAAANQGQVLMLVCIGSARLMTFGCSDWTSVAAVRRDVTARADWFNRDPDRMAVS